MCVQDKSWRVNLVAISVCLLGGLAQGDQPNTLVSDLSHQSASEYFPPAESKGGWRKLDDPQSIRTLAGMDSEKLDGLREWLYKSDDRDFSAVVIRHGYVVLEAGRGDHPETDSRRVASVSKAVCATVLAIAAERSQQGLTPKRMTFDDKAFDFIPWAYPLSDPRKSEITVKQLLNHTSGICPEALGAKNDGSWEYVLGHSKDPPTEALAFAPGTASGYSTHAFAHASLVCETVTGQAYDQFAIEALFKPIGCENWWFQFYEGGEKYGRHPSHGIGMPARDLCRIGYCMLRNGRWEKNQVVPQWFVEQTAHSTHRVQSNEMRSQRDARMFSHGWELPAILNDESVQGVPTDARYKPGSGGQLLAFVPSLDLVIARQTGGSGPWKYNEFLRQACEAVIAEKQPEAKQDSPLEPIDITPFRSCIQHWRDLRDESRFIKVEAGQPSYPPDQVRAIITNILLFQRENGGWPKDYDMTAILTPEQRGKVVATRANNDTSYDNGNIHSQVGYLARAVAQLDAPDWRKACENGFDFILRSQYSNGGFPQRFPNPSGFHAHITFNDGVMMGVMNLLDDAARGAKHFAWLDEDRRQKAKQAVARGIDCILRSQIRIKGVRTGWCQQHDEVTFEPRSARTFELASICPQETTEIATFLLRQPSRTKEMTESVASAVAWLKSVRIEGIRLEKIKSTQESFLRHDTDIDVVVLKDPKAKAIWARHYDLETNQPIFAGRDGIKKFELSAIERERRTGTAWYGYWPQSLVDRATDPLRGW